MGRYVRAVSVCAVLFDFDGLLVDTEMAGYRAWAALYDEFGITPRFDLWCEHVLAVSDHIDLSEELAAAVGRQDWESLHARRRHIRSALSTVMPGATEIVATTRESGLRTGIVSNSSGAWLAERMDYVGMSVSAFDVIITADDGLLKKPAPDAYLAALAALGIRPDQAVAFEDAPRGVEAARAAGLFCVAVPNEVTALGDFRLANRVFGSLERVTMRDLLDAAEDFYSHR